MDSNFQVKITADLGDLVAKIKNIEVTLSKLDGSFKTVSSRATSSLQSTGQAAATAGLDMNRMRLASFALGQVLRDSGFFAQSFGMGLLAISNNIPILIDQLVLLTNVSKGLGAAISLMGSVLTAVLTVFAYASMSAEKYDDSLDKIRATAETNVVTLNSLLSIAKDLSLSDNVRQQAINKLNEEYEIFNESLSLQTINSKKVKDATDALTRSILLQAEAQVIQNELQDVIAQKRKLEGTDLKDQAGYWDKFIGKTKQFNDAIGVVRKTMMYGGFAEIGSKMAKGQEEYNKTISAAGLANFNADMQKLDDTYNKLTASTKSNLLAQAELGQLAKKPKGKETDEQKRIEKIRDVYIELGNELKKIKYDTLSSDLEKANATFDVHKKALQSLLDNAVNPLSSGYKRVESDLLSAMKAVNDLEGKRFAGNLEILKIKYKSAELTEREAEAKKKQLETEKQLGDLVVAPETEDPAIVQQNSSFLNLIANIGKTKESLMDMGNILVGPLAGAFQTMMQTGDFSFKSIISALGQVIIKLVAAIAAAAILAAVLSALSGGAVGGAAGAKALSFKGAFSGLMAGKGMFPGTKFASGGIVSGPTNALIGEYPGAKNNPEVVAPLDKLKSLISSSGSGEMAGQLEARISGNDLVILMNRASKNRNGYY